MPRGSKRRNQSQGALGRRWSSVKVPSCSDPLGEEYKMDVDENGSTKVLECYFKHGPNKDKSKGLVEIAKDLGVPLPPKVKLDEIRAILSQHRAFQNVNESH